MNDSEIIKGLQRMSNEDPDGFSSDILNLIKRQQAEIDTMKDIMAKLLNTLERANKYGLDADEKIEQFKIELEKAKSEAVREFAERLKKEVDFINTTRELKRTINKLVEEMG